FSKARLEFELQRKLHDPGIVSLRDESAEIGAAQVLSFIGQVLHHGMVKHVEEFRPELQFASLRYAKVFVHREIHVPETGITKRIAASSARTPRSGETELCALFIRYEYAASLRIRRRPDRSRIPVEIRGGVTFGGERCIR